MPLCGANQFVNSTNQCQCNHNYLFHNGICTYIYCNSGYFFNSSAGQCQPYCGPYMFVNSNNQCQCYAGFVYDTFGIGCHRQCSTGYRFNYNTGLCEKVVVPPICGPNEFVNASNLCQCLNGYIPDPTGAAGCILQCSPGQTYNYTTQSCQAIVCPAGYQLNTFTNKC